MTSAERPEQRTESLRPGERIPTRSELETLAKQNPILNILNGKTLTSKFAGGWDPIQFNPVQFVDVLTADGPQEKLVDGYHRFAIYLYLSGIWQIPALDGVLERKAPDNPLTIINTNQSYLKNPTIVFPEEERLYHDGKYMLSPEQYARALVLPTDEQPEIAKSRKAAHIMELWESKVGLRLANIHPALKALAIIDTRTTEQQAEFFSTATEEDQGLLKSGIHSVQHTIPEIKAYLPDLIRDTLAIVALQPETIGGEEAAFNQLRGMLEVPPLNPENRFPVSPRLLDRLFKNLIEMKSGTAYRQGLKNEFEAIYRAYTHPDIPRINKAQIIESKAPSSRLYDWENNQRRQRNRERVARFGSKTPRESPPKQIARLTTERDTARRQVLELTEQNQTLERQLAAANHRIAQLEAQSTDQAEEGVVFTVPERKQAIPIDWDNVRVGLRDWKTFTWIDAVTEINMPLVTRIIEQKARYQLFRALNTPQNWNSLLGNLQLPTVEGEPLTGLDAIHASLTPGLITASKEGRWTKDHPEVGFVIADHLRMMLIATRPFYRNAPDGLDELEEQLRIVEDGKLLYEARHLPQKTSYFKDLLQLLVYNPPTDPTHQEAAKYLFKHSGDKEVMNKWKTRTGQRAIEPFVLAQLSVKPT